MHNDQAGIFARPPLASHREDAAEREWARLERLLSSESGAGWTGRPATSRGVAMLPKRKVAALGLLGFLGSLGALLYAFAVPSLGIAPRDGLRSSPVATAEAAQRPAITADPLPDVQSGRSTSIVAAPYASTPHISRPIAMPRLPSSSGWPTKGRRAVTVVVTQRTKQARGSAPNSKPRETAIRDDRVETEVARRMTTTRRYGSWKSFRVDRRDVWRRSPSESLTAARSNDRPARPRRGQKSGPTVRVSKRSLRIIVM